MNQVYLVWHEYRGMCYFDKVFEDREEAKFFRAQCEIAESYSKERAKRIYYMEHVSFVPLNMSELHG